MLLEELPPPQESRIRVMVNVTAINMASLAAGAWYTSHLTCGGMRNC
jgi:hypothetical protein